MAREFYVLRGNPLLFDEQVPQLRGRNFVSADSKLENELIDDGNFVTADSKLEEA